MSRSPGRPPARRRLRTLSRTLLFALSLAAAMPSAGAGALGAPVMGSDEAPRLRALMDQAWAVESGRNGGGYPALAALLYCQAGRMGSAEAYYRAGRAQLAASRMEISRQQAAELFALAAQLGNRAAADALEKLGRPAGSFSDCELGGIGLAALEGFDLEHYVATLPTQRRHVAALIRRLAPHYGIDHRLALAVASAESGFDRFALSPKEAMGVMQLIPATAERFGVRNPYDPEQNIRGGLAYLRWLHRRFQGDWVRVVAAYNAGERAVENYGGVPPYPETRDYVARVLRYARFNPNTLPPTAAGEETASLR